MAKKGELKPMDAWEQEIKERAVAYNVICFIPGQSTRTHQSFDNLPMAIEYSKIILKEPNRIRSAMVYAIDDANHHALVGSVGRHDLEWKPVVAKTY